MARTTTTTTNSDGTLTTTVTDAPQDSIEISVNAKGEPSWSIKVYGEDAVNMMARLTAARALAELHAEAIRERKGGA